MLRRHRFVIMANGYASVVPAPSSEVHGILWRITPRDLAALDAYEDVAGGLYRRVMLPVIADGRSLQALVYLGAEKREGDPRTGYMELVVQAARENGLPEDYIESLAATCCRGDSISGVRHRRPDMSERIIRHAIIRGRVQGVGYRDWTRYVARERGVEGWVRNRKDGSVEAVFAGTREAVAGMLAGLPQRAAELGDRIDRGAGG